MTEAQARRVLGELFVGVAVGLTWPFVTVVLAFGLFGENAITVAVVFAVLIALLVVVPGATAAKLRGGAVAAVVGLSLLREPMTIPSATAVLVAGSSLIFGAVLMATAEQVEETAE